MSIFLRYSFSLDYKIEHTGSVNVPNATYNNKIEDRRREEVIIVPIESDVILALDKECLEYIKEQMDASYKRGAANIERLTIPGSMAFNSALEIVQWQDLSNSQQMKYLKGGYEIYYQRVQETVAEAISIFERKRQLDSVAPDSLLVSQTPAPDTALKDAAQPPAAGKQTGKEPSQKPRAGSGGRKQNNFKLPAGDAGINTLLGILRYLRDRKTQKWIAGKIGFDESNWNKEGTLGECLRKLKQRAEQYPNKEDSDWLACAALSKGLNEAELDLDKDINRREVPMGVMNDRDQWEK